MTRCIGQGALLGRMFATGIVEDVGLIMYFTLTIAIHTGLALSTRVLSTRFI